MSDQYGGRDEACPVCTGEAGEAALAAERATAGSASARFISTCVRKGGREVGASSSTGCAGSFLLRA